MSFKRPHPSDLLLKSFRTASRRTAKGVHAFDTEARSLEQACDLIAEKQRAAKGAATKKAQGRTLRQLFSDAANSARLRAGYPGIRKEKTRGPHPFRDLPETKKRLKAREMFNSRCWGIGLPAQRRIARVFGVSVGQIAVWLED